ncbi:MAG: response regulator [Armatimonadota bacterium]|nr:response regulator [Armatimonadota bacterium]
MTAADSSGAVLVVDDEPQIRSVCQEALEKAGYEVVTAADGASGLQALEGRQFDAAVLDIVLPDTDGLQLLRAVRERDEDVVVVLVTGFATLDTAMEAVRLGAYEYVRKPFGASDLVRIIRRGLEGRRLKGRNEELLEELRRANEELLQQQEQLQERMRIATDDLTAFVELGRRLAEGGDLTQTLRAMLRAGMQITRARAAAVYRVHQQPPRLRGLVAEGMAERDVVGVQLPMGEGLLGRAAAGGAQIENDVLAGPIADDQHLSFLGVQSVLAAPLVCADVVVGVVAFFDQESGGFSEESMDLVRVLSSQAARVVEALAEADEDDRGEPDSGEFVDLTDLL